MSGYLEFGEYAAVLGTTAERLVSTARNRRGEILVARGVISRLELASALADQWSSLQKLRPPFFGLQSDSFARQGEGCEHGLAVGGAAKAVSLGPHG